MTITFYDIPSKAPGKAWSPNTFKTRIALNFKGLPYTTEWVEYPDIEPLLKKLGGKPTSKKADGRDHYTLPAIHDSKTGKVVTDSRDIAIYLDETYPDTPRLFPAGTLAAIELQNNALYEAFDPVFPLVIHASNNNLLPASEPYFRSTREQRFGKKLEELAPPGPIRQEIWAEFKAKLENLANAYDANGPGKPFFFADMFTYADVVVAGFFIWIKVVLGANEEWKEVASWHGGRWGTILDGTEKWQAIN